MVSTPIDQLRVGIMCNSLTFSAWEADTIRQIINIDGVSIDLLIGNADIIEPISNNYKYQKNNLFRSILRIPKKIFQGSKRIIRTPLWLHHQRFVNKHYPASCDIPIPMSSELIDIDMIYCRVHKKGKYSQYFSDNDIEKIKSYKLDIILRFGFNIIRGEILEVPKYGVWSFHHGDYLKYRGGPPGFWEILNEDELSGAILQRLTDKLDDGVVLYQSNFRTLFNSYCDNKNQLFWGTTKWPSIVCNALLSNGEIPYDKTEQSTAPIYTAPNNLQTIKYFYIVLKHRLISRFKKQNTTPREKWAIGIIHEPVKNLINSLKQPKIKWLHPPQGRFYADPFVINDKDANYIFFEDYLYNEERGRISYIQTKDFNTFSNVKPVIEEDRHMSYPFLIKDRNNYYCIPEQHESNKVVLYKAKNFPNEWIKQKILLEDFAGIDPTLIKYNDLWWMFLANQKDNDSSKLYLYYSEEIEGHWKSHQKNPVKVFPKTTRPAGEILNIDGKLIRPAQNCIETYGGNIIFYQILTLTKNDYKEKYLGELLPNQQSPYPDGLHHITTLQNTTIIDGKIWK